MISILVARPGRFPRTGTRLLAAAVLAVAGAGASAADVQRGATLYAAHCSVCHGTRGVPVLPGAPDFRRFDSLLRPDAQLLQTIRAGRASMPSFMGVLKDREILDVIAYLRTLSQ